MRHFGAHVAGSQKHFLRDGSDSQTVDDVDQPYYMMLYPAAAQSWLPPQSAPLFPF